MDLNEADHAMLAAGDAAARAPCRGGAYSSRMGECGQGAPPRWVGLDITRGRYIDSTFIWAKQDSSFAEQARRNMGARVRRAVKLGTLNFPVWDGMSIQIGVSWSRTRGLASKAFFRQRFTSIAL